MTQTSFVTATRGRSFAMDASDDFKLWKAIVQRRDREAFVALYHRHEQAAYNLAFHITRNREEAEEAVQEAMVRVWKSAHSFRAEGSVRSWLLRIVARESLRRINRELEQRKDEAAMARQETIGFSEAAPEVAAERQEMLALLQKQVDALPSIERQLLALHFGGGLSQEEIGAALSQSQQSVSMRIKKALERLRANLSAAGMAAALPLIETGGLSDSFQTGLEVPPGLSAKTLNHFSKVAQESMRRGAAAGSAAKSVGTMLLVLGVCGAAAAVFYWFSGAGANPPAAKPAPTATPAVIEEPRFARKWTFEKGAHEDFKIVNGTSWTWQAGTPKMPAAMVPASDTHVLALLPTKVPARPMRITGTVRLMPGTAVGVKVLWSDGERVRNDRVWSTSLSMQYTNAPLKLNIHIFEQWEVIYLGERLWGILEHTKPYPGDHLVFGIQNCRIEELEVKEVALDEIPADVRKPEELIAKAGFRLISENNVPVEKNAQPKK